MKYLKNRKGTAILELLIVVLVVSMIGIKIIPDFNRALSNRTEKTIENYNGTDTITEFD